MTNNKQSQNPSTIKGRILESVIAAMHEYPDSTVSKNVKILGKSKRFREIDVLIEGSLSGYPIKIVIECKNYKKAINIQHIDNFIGKLEDIGLSSGIYISTRGFDKGAIARAEEAGIRLYTLDGLHNNHLESLIFDAIQTITYIIAEIYAIQMNLDSNNKKDTKNPPILINSKDNSFYSFVQDLLWEKWINNEIPSRINSYNIKLLIPNNVKALIDGELIGIESINISYDVVGITLNIPGKGTFHTLRDTNDKINKIRIDTKFNPIPSIDIERHLTEDDLNQYLSKKVERIKTNARIKIPRIFCNHIFWPISQHIFEQLGGSIQEDSLDKLENYINNAGEENFLLVGEPLWRDNPILGRLSSN